MGLNGEWTPPLRRELREGDSFRALAGVLRSKPSGSLGTGSNFPPGASARTKSERALGSDSPLGTDPCTAVAEQAGIACSTM